MGKEYLYGCGLTWPQTGFPMDRKKIVKNLADIGKDIFIAFIVVAVIMMSLWAYCGIWPPMVVVESGSMQRYDNRSVLGVIDTGDMVFVKTVDGPEDIKTYVDGEAAGYSKYGNYGDVIIYRPNGLVSDSDGAKVTPIIHRAVVWLEVNASGVNPDHDGIDYLNYSFDVPSLGLYGTTDDIVIENYGFWQEEVTIQLSMQYGLLRYYEYLDMEPHGGYITMGDHNAPAYDQPLSGSYEPVLQEWIVGKAWGEIPWFGLVKLKVTGEGGGAPQNSWRNLFISVFMLLFIPFVLDMAAPRFRKWRMSRKGRGAAGIAPPPRLTEDSQKPPCTDPDAPGSDAVKPQEGAEPPPAEAPKSGQPE